MISLLIFAIVVCLVCGVLIYCVRLLPIPAPFSNIVVVLIILIGLLVVVGRHVRRHRRWISRHPPHAGAVRLAGSVGLGLSLVKSIAERHGGIASCEDNPGGGACFVIRLPLHLHGETILRVKT